jgi:indole-3-glycerol phosphate synthase
VITKAPDLLAAIVAATRRITAVREAERPAAVLARQQTRDPRGADFADALRAGPAPRIIAECKRRSPSRGILRADYAPAQHAAAYAQAGAAAISVLTEPTFFDGAPEHLVAVRATVDLPILRKDFILSEYQLLESAVLGADAVLLIVGALEPADLRGLLRAATAMGLASLVEVHDLAELQVALDAGVEIVGVNSRNLRTLEVNISVLDRVAETLPRDVTAVAESGIKQAADIRRLGAATRCWHRSSARRPSDSSSGPAARVSPIRSARGASPRRCRRFSRPSACS